MLDPVPADPLPAPTSLRARIGVTPFFRFTNYPNSTTGNLGFRTARTVGDGASPALLPKGAQARGGAQAPAGTLWFLRNRFSGSYLVLIVRRRSAFPP